MPLGFRSDDDLDITIKESDEAQQSFGREPIQFVVLELRHVRLWNAEELGCTRLRQTAGRDQLVEPHRELHAQPSLVGAGGCGLQPGESFGQPMRTWKW